MIWATLGMISVVLLAIFSGRANAVWGGFTAGIIGGSIAALFFWYTGGQFDWHIVAKWAISGVMIGLAAELLGKLGMLFRKD